MTKLGATSIAVFLATAALALGACGDDGGSKDSATTGTDATQATTGTTETTTETTETRERTTKTDTTKTDTGKRKREDKGGSSGGGSDDSSGSGGRANSPEKQLTSKNTYSTAKTVCNSFLPNVIVRDLKSGKKSPEDIAREYSAGYPGADRKKAYNGCLAGLKARDD